MRAGEGGRVGKVGDGRDRHRRKGKVREGTGRKILLQSETL